MLYLSTSGGTMKIKLDANTDLSSVGTLVENQGIAVAVYRGDDAYLHAAKIVKTVEGGAQSAASYSTPAVATTSTSGTVNANSTKDMLYLNTSGGTMQIKLDNNTDTSACKVMYSGQPVKVEVYRGNDEYLHAAKITWSEGTYSQASLDSNTVTVTGTAVEITKDYTLSLSTSGGTMKIRVDGNSNLGDEKAIFIGKVYNVTVARGTDEYLHVVSVSQ